ncbi:uncharacterized protein N7498_010183 [Penicillium cinerascens]|uniref:Uncharacterized protein n=1 Tax=Penicillium cinerascens TaxID=70096 RepID=A0A9W9M6Y8_9EURO|nr:uncharacterized protein N7498_010183 [Penicillium cinerascens]KAJ5191198.1 hypothetical protein N7498_010183 [Penicillium cinerascens]
MAQPSQTFQASNSFEKLQSYSFHTDPEFANGLAIILGHPGTPATQEEMNREDDLVLQAKCFFFSRKENLNPPIDFAAYKSWSLSRSAGEPKATAVSSLKPDESESSSEANVSGIEPPILPEPAYPSSFAHIVELITTGQPIPGIEQIPDTVLTGHDTASEKPRRRKPWERDDAELSPGETTNQAA